MKIEFTFNYKILFLLIFPIVFQFESPVIELYVKKEKNYLFFKIFKIFLSYLFFIILLLIINYRTRKISKKKKSEEDKNKTIDNDTNYSNENENENKDDLLDQIEIELKKKKLKTIRKNMLALLGLSLTDLIAYFINYYEYDEKEEEHRIFFFHTIGIVFEIITFGLLSYFLFNQKFYRHHFVSSAIIFILLLILFVSYVLQKSELNYYIIIHIFLHTLFYSIYNVSGKKYLDEYYKTPYYMLFIIGLLNSILLLLYDIIAYFINDTYSGIIKGFRENIDSFLSFVYLFIELIIKFIYTLGIWLTIYYFTPYHFIISDFISELIKFYIRVIKQSEQHSIYIIVFSVIYVINFICSLIFNEIIILKFYNLHFYTKKYINKRQRIESSLLRQSAETLESILSQ